MKRANQVASLLLFVLAVLGVRASLGMKLFSDLGPDSGFFTLLLSVVLLVLAVVNFVQVTSHWLGEDPPFLAPQSRFRVLSILGAQLFFALACGLVGFRLTMFAYLAFLLMAVGDQDRRLAVVLAASTSVGLYLGFREGLAVPLPTPSISILKELGF
jgi:hypothetical protein